MAIPDHGPLDFSEFTEIGYKGLVELARQRYRFATFVDRGEDRHILWRHDLDLSVHRALRLAQIERDQGVVATYFFMLRSDLYNLAERSVLDRAREIVDMGHRAGLHFQSEAWPNESWTSERLEELVGTEKNLLASLLCRDIEAVSFHNPESISLATLNPPTFAGLVNAYSRELRDTYDYCSDSNGYWRFKPLRSVLQSGQHDRLHVLTHPGWWTPEPMPPRARVERCVSGRARATLRAYDRVLDDAGRRNIS